MDVKDRRCYVREDFPFDVKFRILTPDEYKAIKGSGGHDSPDKEIATDVDDRERVDSEITPNARLIDFLLHMDEKLDQILALLAKDGADTGLLNNRGRGINISGAGMNIVVDKPVEPGQVIHAHFILSRFPLVFIDVFGEVTWVKPLYEHGNTAYRLGITFLELNSSDREKIIACVFQRQREMIRKSKSQELG
jgi:hypothetical protein